MMYNQTAYERGKEIIFKFGLDVLIVEIIHPDILTTILETKF